MPYFMRHIQDKIFITRHFKIIAFTALQKRMQDWYENQIQSLQDANDALKEQVEKLQML